MNHIKSFVLCLVFLFTALHFPVSAWAAPYSSGKYSFGLYGTGTGEGGGGQTASSYGEGSYGAGVYGGGEGENQGAGNYSEGNYGTGSYGTGSEPLFHVEKPDWERSIIQDVFHPENKNQINSFSLFRIPLHF